MLAWLDSETFSPFTHCSLRGQKLCVEKAVGVERIDKASTMYTLLPVYISYSSVSYVVATEADSVVGAFVSRFEAAIASAGKPRHDWTWRRQAQWRWWRRRCTVGPNCKSPPKMRFKKIRDMYLQRFWQILNVKRRQPEMEIRIWRNFHGKTREINLSELMFWRIFDIWNYCALHCGPK